MLLLPSLLLATHIHWLGDYDRAHQKALREHKKMLVYLIQPKCTPCKLILKEALMDHPYIDRLNQNFISVIVNYTNIRDFPNELYYSNEYPALFFVDEKTETFLTSPLKKDKINAKNIEKILDKLDN
jgi:thiol-disulfide isomerase/thioredoxin